MFACVCVCVCVYVCMNRTTGSNSDHQQTDSEAAVDAGRDAVSSQQRVHAAAWRPLASVLLWL